MKLGSGTTGAGKGVAGLTVAFAAAGVCAAAGAAAGDAVAGVVTEVGAVATTVGVRVVSGALAVPDLAADAAVATAFKSAMFLFNSAASALSAATCRSLAIFADSSG